MSSNDDEAEARSTLGKAWWMAMSGMFADWRAIEAQLISDGFPDVPQTLTDPAIRAQVDKVCDAASRGPHHPRDDGEPSDEATIWRVIDDEHAAFWNRDFPAYSQAHSASPFEQWLAWIRVGGTVMHEGWDQIGTRMQLDMRQDPDKNPYFAFQFKRQRSTLRVASTMAWATYDIIYPTSNLIGFHGPSTTHEVRILEKLNGQWKIVLVSIMDEQQGQTDVPTWQVDGTGRVVEQNYAAKLHLEGETELVVRGGRLQMQQVATDVRLHQLIKWCASRRGGIMSAYECRPLIYDPGNDMPARVWWIKADCGKVFVSFNDPQLAEQRLMTAATTFGLSPSQQRLVVSIVEGLALTDAARRAGVQISTARTQLQRIFDKVGVRTQPALVRVLLTSGEPG
ncbi:hypothetical protein [Devosia sp.]|uniref:hypothetical protein n=1 Tax=Devosia sp. TaxID=1871048 RepID=UPI003266E224